MYIFYHPEPSSPGPENHLSEIHTSQETTLPACELLALRCVNTASCREETGNVFLAPKAPTNTPDGEVTLTTPLHSSTLLEPTLSHAILPLKYAVEIGRAHV